MEPVPWTICEVAHKSSGEGGIVDMLYWGLSSAEIGDPELASLYQQLEAIRPVLDRIYQILDDHECENEEE